MSGNPPKGLPLTRPIPRGAPRRNQRGEPVGTSPKITPNTDWCGAPNLVTSYLVIVSIATSTFGRGTIMSHSIEHDPNVLTGSRLEQLATAFDRVRDPRDWKAPIESVIAASERGLVEQAVLMFTNTVPTFAEAEGTRDRLVVRATGYRSGPLGDASDQACA